MRCALIMREIDRRHVDFPLKVSNFLRGVNANAL